MNFIGHLCGDNGGGNDPAFGDACRGGFGGKNGTFTKNGGIVEMIDGADVKYNETEKNIISPARLQLLK